MSDKNKNLKETTAAEEASTATVGAQAAEILVAVEQEEQALAQQSEKAIKPIKAKKPKKPWTVKRVLGFVALGLVAIFAVNIIIGLVKGPGPIYVQTQKVQQTQLQQTLSTSGIINSAQMATVFSPVTAPVSTVHVAKGQLVQQGQLMFEYNVTDLERSYRQAAAAAAVAGAQANQANSANQESQDKTNALPVKIDNLKIDIRNKEAEIAALNIRLAERLAAPELAGQTPEQMQQDPQVKELNQHIAAATAAIAQLKQDLMAYEAQLEAAKKGVLDANGQTIVNNQGVPAYVAFEVAKQNLAAGKAGISAPISGVITAISVVKGGLCTQYTVMCVIESIEEVDVIISLSRYDLESVKQGQKGVVETGGKEYAATIKHIDSMATQGATGSYVMAKVSIDKPDKDIRLGIEAKVKINTNFAKDVLTVAISAISTDVNGTYCFVMQDGVAIRREVSLGISNDTMVVVSAGLAQGEQVILNTNSVYDGAAVTNDPAAAPPETNGFIMG